MFSFDTQKMSPWLGIHSHWKYGKMIRSLVRWANTLHSKYPFDSGVDRDSFSQSGFTIELSPITPWPNEVSDGISPPGYRHHWTCALQGGTQNPELWLAPSRHMTSKATIIGGRGRNKTFDHKEQLTQYRLTGFAKCTLSKVYFGKWYYDFELRRFLLLWTCPKTAWTSQEQGIVSTDWPLQICLSKQLCSVTRSGVFSCVMFGIGLSWTQSLQS